MRNFNTGILGFYETQSFVVLNNQKMMLSQISCQNG